MKLNSYLTFDGKCEEAFKFYERCLGGKIQAMLPHAGSPVEEHVQPEWRDKILHACLDIDGQALMGSDAPPSCYQKPGGFSVSLQIKGVTEAERVFKELGENGMVQMPLQQRNALHD